MFCQLDCRWLCSSTECIATPKSIQSRTHLNRKGSYPSTAPTATRTPSSRLARDRAIASVKESTKCCIIIFPFLLNHLICPPYATCRTKVRSIRTESGLVVGVAQIWIRAGRPVVPGRERFQRDRAQASGRHPLVGQTAPAQSLSNRRLKYPSQLSATTTTNWYGIIIIAYNVIQFVIEFDRAAITNLR